MWAVVQMARRHVHPVLGDQVLGPDPHEERARQIEPWKVEVRLEGRAHATANVVEERMARLAHALHRLLLLGRKGRHGALPSERDRCSRVDLNL